MTAKEKAIKLVNKYYYLDGREMYIGKAKQCALIAVDEIIKEIKDTTFGANTRMVNDRLDFWYEVKDEINNL